MTTAVTIRFNGGSYEVYELTEAAMDEMIDAYQNGRMIRFTDDDGSAVYMAAANIQAIELRT